MRWYKWVYEGVMASLAVAVVWLLTLPQQDWVNIANLAIWIVFAADYVTRFALAKDRKKFFYRNIFELIAIMPLNHLRVLRAVRLVRLARVVRVFSIFWRMTKDVRGVMKTNGLRYVLAVTVALIVICGVGIMVLEPSIETIGNGIWWGIVTTTTVGYGDISPDTLGGRIIAIVLMVVGIGTIGMLTGSIATYFIKLGKRGGGNCHIDYIQKQLERWNELSFAERIQLAELFKAVAESGAAAAEEDSPTLCVNGNHAN